MDIKTPESLHKAKPSEHEQFLLKKYEEKILKIRSLRDAKKASKEITREILRLEHIAMKDRLTGAYNRAYLVETLPREIIFSRKMKIPLSVVMIDCDYLKKINDEEPEGHIAGDRVLKGLVKIINRELRKAKIIHFLSRFGGEEWTLVLDNVNREKLKIISTRILIKIEEELSLMAKLVKHDKVTISMGGCFVEKSDNMKKIFNKIDKALYRAKEERNKFVDYSEL